MNTRLVYAFGVIAAALAAAFLISETSSFEDSAGTGPLGAFGHSACRYSCYPAALARLHA
ncbi:hypothetical protein BJN34_08665 [Cupriavidus necator]|uniref:Uncharacterized protein n=1 Tax=Cupriavidus necator TaxID=106590 RepID=A0A1U9UMV2_CUPNE|nr:hypothetical protein [Cupriavidus necator]AQV93963.1 hypothetical protein BJN34_08665 [Cupriavidus necator]